jgi:hypothetical protein
MEPGNRQRENIVVVRMRYSYHGIMMFWEAAERYRVL